MIMRYLCGFCSIVEMNKVIDANQTICMCQDYDMIIFAANLTVQADCTVNEMKLDSRSCVRLHEIFKTNRYYSSLTFCFS